MCRNLLGSLRTCHPYFSSSFSVRLIQGLLDAALLKSFHVIILCLSEVLMRSTLIGWFQDLDREYLHICVRVCLFSFHVPIPIEEVTVYCQFYMRLGGMGLGK